MVTEEKTSLSDSRNIMVFGGKGGVGKTTCAAATAVHYADLGKRTLCISTDPTPSLSHIFNIKSREKPYQVAPLLYVSELGVDEVKEMWDRKFGPEVYEVFSSFVSVTYPAFTEFMTSILPGLGDEFVVDYIRELKLQKRFETIIWDTAPLGQTLALLETPSLLAKHLRMAPRIYSRMRLGARSREPILDILKRWEKLSALNMDFIRSEVFFTYVTIPETLAVEQLEPVSQELNKYGIQVQNIIVNNVIQADGSKFLAIKAERQKNYLNLIRQKFACIPVIELPLVSYEIRGTDNLRELAKSLF